MSLTSTVYLDHVLDDLTKKKNNIEDFETKIRCNAACTPELAHCASESTTFSGRASAQQLSIHLSRKQLDREEKDRFYNTIDDESLYKHPTHRPAFVEPSMRKQRRWGLCCCLSLYSSRHCGRRGCWRLYRCVYIIGCKYPRKLFGHFDNCRCGACIHRAAILPFLSNNAEYEPEHLFVPCTRTTLARTARSP